MIFKILVLLICMQFTKVSSQGSDCILSCSENAKCVEGICICNRGFVGDSNACTDINECISTCNSEASICENLPGSYKCTCKKGFELREDESSCDDINECLRTCNSKTSICENTPGSYKCTCAKGFKLHEDGSSCDDINECLSICNSKTSICENTPGSYKCTCKKGFKLHEDGSSCDDINECLSICNSKTSICENTPGSYKCTCKKGFKLHEDGSSCDVSAPCSCLLEITDTCIALNKDEMESQGKCYSEKLLSDIKYLDKTKENLVVTEDKLRKCQIQLRKLLPTFIDEYDECAFNIHYLNGFQTKLYELKNNYGYLQKLFREFTKNIVQKDTI